MYDQIMTEVCNWCIRFLYKASDYLGMSYEEINVWLFIIIQPGLIIYFFLSSSMWKKNIRNWRLNNRKNLGFFYEF